MAKKRVRTHKKRSPSLPGEIVSAILNSQIGESLNDKLRQLLGLPPQESSPKIKEEARGVTDKIRNMKNAPYRILGVDPLAEEAVIRSAYKAKARLYHPDRGGSEAKMSEINEAYTKICQERGWKP
jgi:DnaJ-domain-containing protein 1